MALFLIAACGGAKAPAAEAPPTAPASRAPFVDGDVVAYKIKDGAGRLVGRAHTRYSVRDDRPSIVTRVGIGKPAVEGQALSFERTVEYATIVRTDLSPVGFKRLSSSEGRLELIFRTGFVSVISDGATKDVPYTFDGAVLLPTDDLVILALALGQAGVEPGYAKDLKIQVPETASVDRWPVQVYADAQRRTVVKLPGGTATLDARGRIQSLAATDGRQFELEDPPGDAPALLAQAGISAKYERPAQASWNDREVSVDTDAGPLAATFSIPKSRSRAVEARLPAVLLAQDWPRGDRHGFTGAQAAGAATPGFDRGTWQLFDRLADDGFVVLRVDARLGDGGLDRAIGDLKAAIAFLKRQGVVDPQRVHLLGHGFGALEAIQVAGEEQLSTLTLLAPVFRPSELLKGKQQTSLAADYAKLDVAALLKKVEEPIAVVQGLKDIEVSWREDGQALAEAVNKQKRGQAKLMVYEYVDHLLKTQTSASTFESYQDRGRKLDPQLLDALVVWLAR